MLVQVTLWLTLTAQTQEAPPALHPEWVNWTSFDSVSGQTWMERIGVEASSLPWDRRADTLFSMSQNATRAVFGVDSLRLRARSANAPKGTILVHWEFVSGRARGDIYLEDRPLGASFGVRVKQLSPEEMAEVAPKLFGVTPKIQVASDGSAQFTWGVDMAQFDMMNYRATATRNPRSGDWFMTVTHSLRLRAHYRGVTEQHRIPAYRDMIRTWPLERLFAGLSPQNLTNQLLLEEIVTRKVPPNRWQDILLWACGSPEWIQKEVNSTSPCFTSGPVYNWLHATPRPPELRPEVRAAFSRLQMR